MLRKSDVATAPRCLESARNSRLDRPGENLVEPPRNRTGSGHSPFAPGIDNGSDHLDKNDTRRCGDLWPGSHGNFGVPRTRIANGLAPCDWVASAPRRSSSAPSPPPPLRLQPHPPPLNTIRITRGPSPASFPGLFNLSCVPASRHTTLRVGPYGLTSSNPSSPLAPCQ